VSRGHVDGLPSPHPIIDQLPSIYQEDHFARMFTAGFDDVLAPVFNVLDCLEAYIDPYLTPADFLPWLARWVAVTIEEDWPIERQRRFVANAVTLFRYKGTITGLRGELGLYTGGQVEISESGAAAYSRTPNGAFPGEDVPRLGIRIVVDDPSTVSLRGIEEVVAAAKPAHVVHSVEVVARGAR
jgi:phage tail-like protein